MRSLILRSVRPISFYYDIFVIRITDDSVISFYYDIFVIRITDDSVIMIDQYRNGSVFGWSKCIENSTAFGRGQFINDAVSYDLCFGILVGILNNEEAKLNRMSVRVLR